jgi:ferredoxin-NADP reductase
MFKLIDKFLNGTTMYRLVLYYVAGLWGVAFIMACIGTLAFAPGAMFVALAVIVGVAWLTNRLFARVYAAPTNVESVYITAFILALIMNPPRAGGYADFLILAGWAASWSMAAKFIFAINKKHLFNAAAFAVALMAITGVGAASWWIGRLQLAPYVLLGGLLMVRKIRRTDLVASFFAVALAVIAALAYLRGLPPLTAVWKALTDTPLMFFAFVMLTEPLTTPPTKPWRVAYGALVGVLIVPQLHVGALYSTPELALVLGNLFSYLVSPKHKLFLTLKAKKEIATDTFDFVFESDQRLKFRPGQYLEWTLAHDRVDNRGNRRYFTIASAPTEPAIRLGAKFYPRSSSFKSALDAMKPGDTLVATQLAGDFTLPRDPKRKLVFIAGGIGVTPFRSMLKDLIDRHETRDVIVLYSNNTVGEIAYADVFNEAEKQLGIKTHFILSKLDQVPADWKGDRGFIDEPMLRRLVPDFATRTFYISGPHAMVAAFQRTLRKMGVKPTRIKSDFFPGFA